MKKISTYSIQHQQKIFNVSGGNKDYFFLELGSHSLFYPEPRRSEAYSISFLKVGEVLLQAGLVTQVVKAPAVITLGPTVVRTITETDIQPVMEIIFFTDDYLLANRTNVFYLMEFDFFEDEDLHAFALNKTQSKKINRLFKMIREALAAHHLHEPEILRSCINLLIYEINAFHKLQDIVKPSPAETISPLLVNFKQLLYKEFSRERSVAFYAGKLNITPKHLSDLLKKQTGKTAGEWIDEAIILESKVLLQNKELSVSEVAEQLNFSDQSVFGKFFRTHTSLTPLQYRKTAF